MYSTKHRVTATRLAVMQGQARVPVHYNCIPKINIVDKGNSSSAQVNWFSRCCHLALCADFLH